MYFFHSSSNAINVNITDLGGWNGCDTSFLPHMEASPAAQLSVTLRIALGHYVVPVGAPLGYCHTELHSRKTQHWKGRRLIMGSQQCHLLTEP